jgi:hypothetical protein
MAAPMPDVFAHTDPWTEAEFLALPVHRRVELLCAEPGQPLVLTEPIGVTQQLAALAAATRPSC